MTISSVSPNTSSQIGSVKPNVPHPAPTEVRGEKENDGDRDDGGAPKVSAPPAPTVNTSGQTIGSIINVTA